VETKSPSSGYMIPLAPSWVISEKYRVVAVLEPDHKNKRFDIKIITDADKKIYEQAKKGTVQNSRLVDPITNEAIDISTIRGDKKGKNNETIYVLRMWENDDIVPRPNDVFQERLYCIRYIEHKEGSNRYGEPTLIKIKHYVAPDENDLEREERVLELLKKRFHTWQEKGYIPSMKIDPDGVKTQEPIRNRGWTHWHHLFNPRQLLILGIFGSYLSGNNFNVFVGKFLGYGKCSDLASKLSVWHHGAHVENFQNTFLNQALNTIYNFGNRGLINLATPWFYNIKNLNFKSINFITTSDARNITYKGDLWLSDPPYADAINYHELADFFLAWYEKYLPKLFPDWHTDSKKALAVKGSGVDFKRSMVEIYSNLNNNMPDNGMQIVMFTHQDAGVWADLAMILWAADLKVTAAWTIGTETSSGLKQGNYVQGTVLMVLRKRTDHKKSYLDEIYVEIENEVKNQLQTLIEIDDMEDPNFGDTDYQLAAYISAIRVLTKYSDIVMEGI
jgi:adenine-specific DNA methylase